MSVAEILQWAEYEDVHISVVDGRLSVDTTRTDGYPPGLSEAVARNVPAILDYLITHVHPPTAPVADTPSQNGHAAPAAPKRAKTPKPTSPTTPRELSLTERHELENILHDVLMGSMNPSQFTVLLYIARQTLGFNTLSKAIPLKQFSDGRTTRAGERLNRGAGVSASSAKDALKYLEGRGLIHRERRDSEYGDKDSTIYTIVSDAWHRELEAMKHEHDLPPEPKSEPAEVGQNLAGVGQDLANVGQPLAKGLARIWPTVGQPLAYPYKEQKGTVNKGYRGRVRGTSRAARDPTTTHPP